MLKANLWRNHLGETFLPDQESSSQDVSELFIGESVKEVEKAYNQAYHNSCTKRGVIKMKNYWGY